MAEKLNPNMLSVTLWAIIKKCVKMRKDAYAHDKEKDIIAHEDVIQVRVANPRPNKSLDDR